MLPPLRAAYFGLLDDAVTLYINPFIWKDPVTILHQSQGYGRFIPGYFAYIAILGHFAGQNALRWHFASLVLLFTNAILIYHYVHQRSLQRSVGFISALIFLISAPVFENFYTIAKFETVMLVWILIAMNLGVYFSRTRRSAPKLILFTGMTLSFFLSFTIKETALTMIPICLGWLVSSVIWKEDSNGIDRRARSFIFSSCLLAGIVLIALRQQFAPLGEISSGAYTSRYIFEIGQISEQSLRWLGRCARDYIFLVPLLTVLLSKRIRRRIAPGLLAEPFIWMMGWIAIYLPWYTLDLYYTLPFSFGVAMLAGLLIWASVQELSQASYKSKILPITALVATSALGLLVLVNNWMNGQIQIIYDRQNWLLIESLAKLPEQSQIFFNAPDSEYILDSKFFLNKLLGRPDLTIDVLDYRKPVERKDTHFYVVLPIFENEIFPSVRNSNSAPGAQSWNSCFEDFQNDRADVIYRQIDRLQRVDFGFNRLLPGLGIRDLLSIYPKKSDPFLLVKDLKYGWKVDEMKLDPDRIAQPGIFKDGHWRLLTSSHQITEINFGLVGDLPVAGDWDGDGRDEIGIYRPSTHTWMFDFNMDGQADDTLLLGEPKKGAVPIAGDWDGNGSDDPGFYNPDGTWQLFNLSDPKYARLVSFGAPGEAPITGDWNGNGIDTIGTYQATTGVVKLANRLQAAPQVSRSYTVQASSKNTTLYAADWYGIGKDSIALIEGDTWAFLPVDADCPYPNPIPTINFDLGQGIPIGGAWEEPGSTVELH